MWSLFNPLLSPKKFFALSQQILPWFIGLFLVAAAYGLIGGLVLAPADYLQGDGFRIMYVHVPAAFLSIFIYVVMASAAFCHLVWRIKIAPVVIRQSTPLGIMFTFLALLTGSLWGKPMWGTWWIWDARLTSELILLFLYIGIYLFQQASLDKRTTDRPLSILILVGLVDIPIIHYSVYWWNTLHQGSTLSIFSPSAIDSSMLYPLLAMIVAFLLYYAIVLFVRMGHDLMATQANQHWLMEKR